nr:hypothetical protein StreXyl84_79770 [Streptomyces sp. Xyl84]
MRTAVSRENPPVSAGAVGAPDVPELPRGLAGGAQQLRHGSGGEADVGDVFVLAPLGAEVDDVVHPGIVQGLVVVVGSGLHDLVPVPHVHRAVFDDALAGPVDLGLVDGVDLHAGAAAVPVEAGQVTDGCGSVRGCPSPAGDVVTEESLAHLPQHPCARRLDQKLVAGAQELFHA